MTKRIVLNLNDNTSTEETFTYDAAGNIMADDDSAFVYATNNRLTQCNGNPVSLVDPFGLTAERSIGGGLTDLWETEYPEISSSPAILGSLYNLGHNKIPHNNPKPNWFGVEVDYVYNLINEELSQLKEKGVGLI